MLKTRLNFLTTFVLIIIFSCTTFSFATTSDDVMLISNDSQVNSIKSKENTRSDLYIKNKQYIIDGTVEGNVFASVDTLDIISNENGGIITGNVFATAKNVNIKSNIVYSETEKDSLGNPTFTVNNSSAISGNVFIFANTFILEPGCEISGDLYICANKIILGQNSIIYGNVFILGNTIDLNCQIGGDLYATAKNFDMKYYGFIRRDLHLNSKSANINGCINRNSFISSDNIILNDKFINEKNFNIENAKKLIFSGEIKGDANINCKQITFDTSKSTCLIKGNLNYSSKNQLNLENGIVLKEVNYNQYRNPNTLSNIWIYLLNLLATLVSIYLIYFLISKFMSKILYRISKITWISILKSLGIGISFFIIIPIITLLLFVSKIGNILSFIILLLYVILLIISKPIFIIFIATIVKNKISDKLNMYLYILGIIVILSLINLIPYIGFVISALVSFIGSGIIIKDVILSNN